MNLMNPRPLDAGLTLATDKHGFENIVVIAKGTFLWEADRFVIAKEPEKVVRADQFSGEPGRSSVRYEFDFAPFKPFTDLVINGSAYAPPGKLARSVDVSVEVGPIRKTIR